MTKDDPSLFDAISTMIAVVMISSACSPGCSQADPDRVEVPFAAPIYLPNYRGISEA